MPQPKKKKKEKEKEENQPPPYPHSFSGWSPCFYYCCFHCSHKYICCTLNLIWDMVWDVISRLLSINNKCVCTHAQVFLCQCIVFPFVGVSLLQWMSHTTHHYSFFPNPKWVLNDISARFPKLIADIWVCIFIAFWNERPVEHVDDCITAFFLWGAFHLLTTILAIKNFCPKDLW